MISSLRGSAVHVEPGALIVEVGGVGFAVAVPATLSQATRVGDEVHVHTWLVVREDALTLFGFATRDELAAFSLLLGVSGVGPKSALGVLSVLGVDQLAAAVANEDEKPFRPVSGIGPKTAKLIILSLTGKVIAPVGAASIATAPPSMTDAVTSHNRRRIHRLLSGVGLLATASAASLLSTGDAQAACTISNGSSPLIVAVWCACWSCSSRASPTSSRRSRSHCRRRRVHRSPSRRRPRHDRPAKGPGAQRQGQREAQWRADQDAHAARHPVSL